CIVSKRGRTNRRQYINSRPLPCFQTSVSDLRLSSDVLYHTTHRTVIQQQQAWKLIKIISLQKMETQENDDQGVSNSYSRGGYEDSTQFWENCKRNAGHANLIPIDELSAEKLNFIFKPDQLVDLIKLLAYLTVKITVPYSSADRPSGNKLRNGSGARIGTGKICEVSRHEGRCPCPSCVTSGDPASSWAEIKVVTSKRVVYDEDEGRHATCIWGYDNADSQCVQLEGIGAEASEKDFCHVRYVTHDLEFADELANNLMEYKIRRVQYFNDYKDSNVETKLIAVVSHPHGHFKHVSFKVWSDDSDSDQSPSRRNVLDTCHGSRGAPVYILDKEKVWLSNYC
ncbi:hypothetical protein Btru_071070, partial [Bulinus truncatus]